MTTFIQAHYLTVYGPSNLNRDDTGRPKTANFGGVQRLRVSSQSLKRAWRTSTAFVEHFNGTLGHRTRIMGERIRDRMIAAGMSDAAAVKATQALISQFGKLDTGKADAKADEPSDSDGKTKGRKVQQSLKDNVNVSQLYFISPEEMTALELIADRISAGEEVSEKDMIVTSNIMSAPDIAMFGRMVAATPIFNIDAAVQVSHAITTHRVIPDEDYYTAVDDLNTGEVDVGAGFMGTFEFGSGVFYAYVCVDRDQLVRNLQGNEALADQSISVLLEAAATEGPKAKQNSFAHQSRAGYVLLERGSKQPRNLAYAFLKPIDGGRNDDYMASSIAKLREFRTKTDTVYGSCADTTYEINMLEDLGSISGMQAWLAGKID